MLSKSLDSNGKANDSIWTNAIATALSYKQITGDMISTIADTGEANYQLPLFKYERISNISSYWIRDIYNLKQSYYVPNADIDTQYSYLYSKKMYTADVFESKAYREMIYIK